jgi:molybdopterin-containing oxidoreductase family iron-sulfur binding subunit
VNLSEVRSRLSNQRGQALWRSMEELCDTPEFRKSLEREFPGGVDGWINSGDQSRRRFLQLMGASLMLAGAGTMSGCSDKPRDEKIVPYVDAPEMLVAGKPMFFATAMPMGGFGRGVLVCSQEGRPIKIEGNPDHPASLGGTDSFMQASILGLYDPDRSQAVTRGGEISTWAAFWETVRPRLESKRQTGGEGVRLLLEPTTSPTVLAQLDELQRQFPRLRRHHWDPIGRENTTAGMVAAYGKSFAAQYDLSAARVVVSLDSDFLFDESASLRYSRQFMDGRRVRRDRQEMNRLYVAEGTLTITGSTADHRLAIRPSEIAILARALAAACGVSGVNTEMPAGREKWINAAAADLAANRGACLVMVGESQPAEVHALGHAINHLLGNLGHTVHFTEPVLGQSDSLDVLVDEMRSGKIDTLLIFGTNPAYTSPADIPFAAELLRMSKMRSADGTFANLTAHLGLYDDETAYLCQWHLHQSHYLESWGDIRAFDGTASILQPLIAPLYGGKSASEVLEVLLGRPERSAYEVLRGYWVSQWKNADFERQWSTALKSGVIAGTALPLQDLGSPKVVASASEKSAGEWEVVFRPDYSVWDGCFSNNPWLQELPRPFTKLTWDNAAMISPATAEKLNVVDGDVVRLMLNKRSINAPVLVTPGVPDGVISVSLGYGRLRAGHIGTVHGDQTIGVGFDAYAIRTAGERWFAGGVQVIKTKRTHRLVMTRSHHAMGTFTNKESLKPDAIATEQTPEWARETANRKLVRVATLEQFKANTNIIKELGGESEKKPLLSLYPGPEHGGWDYSKGYQWGMSIDLTSCIGCNACVVACQAENNIPVVGKEEISRQREMHWIRIDDYFGGSLDDPKIYHQPVPCMHCENAPCEYVCPVGATTHSVEGLNQMTYNRCVGTRYCSNNCPYKVRRFNFLAYADAETTEQRKLQRNPDVTVRTNGVMEKCSYCIQRIQRTRIEAEKMLVENSGAQQAEFNLIERLQTACQQACPTRAIEFGSIIPVGGEKTRVAKLKDEPLDYGLLRELSTRPRTTYLARLTNPNPSIEPAKGGAA